MIDFQSKRVRRIATAICVLAILPTLWFGVRTLGSFQLLRSAYETGAPETSNLRGWMTLRYVVTNYRVLAPALVSRLALPSDIDLDVSIRSLAERQQLPPFDYVQRVQQAIADATQEGEAATPPKESAGWFAATGDSFLSALLIYGYPALGLILLLGALGLPVPTGLATALAGSLAGRGEFDWMLAGAIAVAASVIGDVLGYGVGRWIGDDFLARRGKWVGYSPGRRVRVQALFARWGGFTVLITRTLVSHLSSVVSVLAGISRYRFAGFFAFALVGRVLWTSAYLGLGYGVGEDIEPAAVFLANLTGFLLFLNLLAISGLVAAGRVARGGENSA
jgi:membrane protein DedA with SNARE-associated domain